MSFVLWQLAVESRGEIVAVVVAVVNAQMSKQSSLFETRWQSHCLLAAVLATCSNEQAVVAVLQGRSMAVVVAVLAVAVLAVGLLSCCHGCSSKYS